MSVTYQSLYAEISLATCYLLVVIFIIPLLPWAPYIASCDKLLIISILSISLTFRALSTFDKVLPKGTPFKKKKARVSPFRLLKPRSLTSPVLEIMTFPVAFNTSLNVS